MRGMLSVATTVTCAVLLSTTAFAQSASITGRREGHVGRGDAGRHGRSGQRRADREGSQRGHRRHRPVPHRRPAARHLRGHVHADRVQHRQARRHRAAERFRRDRQRRDEGRLACRKRSPSPARRRSSTCRAPSASGPSTTKCCSRCRPRRATPA